MFQRRVLKAVQGKSLQSTTILQTGMIIRKESTREWTASSSEKRLSRNFSITSIANSKNVTTVYSLSMLLKSVNILFYFLEAIVPSRRARSSETNILNMKEVGTM